MSSSTNLIVIITIVVIFLIDRLFFSKFDLMFWTIVFTIGGLSLFLFTS